MIERYSYGWCNGPAGDAQVFRLLGALTEDGAWAALADRCWHTVTHCGLPRRVRPGFWDNNGRATVDADGVRWSNHEHRVTPSTLEPHTGWAMRNADIIRELLRFARVSGGADPAYAVPWPDHPPAAPRRVSFQPD